MHDIVEAAKLLLLKMPRPSREGSASWYYTPHRELEFAVLHPHGPPRFTTARVSKEWAAKWKGPADGGVTYWAQQLLLEMSELQEEATTLSEYKELQTLLIESGFPCDRKELTEDEFHQIVGGATCPPELNDKIASVLKQRTKPN